MASLYNIDSKIIELLDNGFDESTINPETGEIDEEAVRFYLDGLGIARNDKIESIALYIKNLEAEASAIELEEVNLKARRKQKENKATKLRTYLTNSMALFGNKKFETPKVALSFRTSNRVEIDNMELIDKKFIKEKIEYTPDKTAIKKAIDNGETVAGAHIKEVKNIQIK